MRTMARNVGSCGLRSHGGNDILEVDITDDRLRVALPFHDREARMHVEVGGDQVVRQRGVRIECAHMFGREHDNADRA